MNERKLKKINVLNLKQSEMRAGLFKVATFVFFSVLFSLAFSQIALATIYQPGATLEPDCAPGSINCGVAVFSLNGQTDTTQTFATGTSGTDFNIASALNIHNFNIPDASAIARGLLTAADWINFNSKQAALVSGTNIKTVGGTSLLGSGDVAVGMGDALTTNPLSQFAATTSAQLAGVISDETGSGALVFATSPVFTTPNIGSATGSVSGNAGTATALQTARTIGGVSFDGTANITVASATGGFTISGGALALGANDLTMTGSLGTTGSRLTKGWFTDLEVTNAIAGSITGNAATVTTNANLTGVITSVGNATSLGSFNLASLNTALSDADVATGGGTVTGTSSGTNTGDQTTITGNAGTATALQTARTIGGVSFDGTANITVASATGGFTVLGGALALGANDLTMTGSLGTTGSRLTKGWFTDLEVTNAIAGSITGNAATVTTNANLTGVITSVGNATSLGSFNLASLNTALSDADVATGGGTVTGTSSGTNTGDQTTITGNAGTATALQTARTIGGVSFDGTANITVASATGGFTVSGGALALGANDLTMTGSLGTTGSRLTKGWFTDLEVTNAIAGSITGNAATVTTNANLTGVITSVGNATSLGSFNLASLNTALSDADVATGGGTVTGTSSGTNTGDQTTITGNAGTATALQTARTIGGVSFDGTANITVASATGGFTVSGGALALGANDLTMTGSLGTTGSRLTKGWFTDLEVTNAIAGSITGNAATVTTNANLTGVITSVGNATSLGSFSSANLISAVTDETGSGLAVFGTAPTFTTDITTPLIIGGTAVGSNIIYKSTTGAGTATGIAHQFVGGTNGGTVAMSILNDGKVGIGVTNPSSNLDVFTSDGTLSFGEAFPNKSGSTDNGISMYSEGSFKSGLFTEVNGELLSYGINVSQIGDRDTAKTGAVFRMDTRASSPYFSVKRQAIGGSTEFSDIQISQAGDIGLGGWASDTNSFPGNVSILSRATTTPGLIVREIAAQTADIMQWQNSAGTTLGLINASGTIAANSGITFDNSTDTVGAHTLSGTIDANTNLITNIGNASTDFNSNGGLTLAENLTIQGTTGLTFNTGAGGDITFANGEKIDNDTNNRINIDVGTTGTLLITSTTSSTIANSAGTLTLDSVGGTVALASADQLLTSSAGIEFTESDTNPTCGAGNYNIFADTSEGKLKKCVNGVVSDLQAIPDLNSFTDSTLAAAWTDANTNELWDDATRPNITPKSTASEILVMVTVRGTVASSGGGDTNNPVARVDREIGVTADCADTNTVGPTIGDLFLEAGGTEVFSLSTVFVDTPTTTSNVSYTVCSSSDSLGLSDTTTATRTEVTLFEVNDAADLAEIYSTNDISIGMGDVVSLDSTLESGVKKSSGINDKKVIGIVSSKPAMVIGGINNEGEGAVPVALSGRVPVKVTTENGAIEPGDYLTTSSTLGVAMKSDGRGPVIGQAMSAFNAEGVGVVVAFVKNFDYGPIVDTPVLMGDISPLVNIDGSDNGLSSLVADIQSENARNPVAIIAQKITDGKQFLTDFVSARVTAIRGYFDEIFANKSHQKILCVGETDNETCITKTQLDELLNDANITPISNPIPQPEPELIEPEGSSESEQPSVETSEPEDLTPKPSSSEELGEGGSAETGEEITPEPEEVVVPEQEPAPTPEPAPVSEPAL